MGKYREEERNKGREIERDEEIGEREGGREKEGGGRLKSQNKNVHKKPLILKVPSGLNGWLPG